MGAWIEIPDYLDYLTDENKSHPLWVRGLKLVDRERLRQIFLSHPLWVRGLKL